MLPLKGTMSAKKALQGFETATRDLPVGTKEKYFLRVINLPSMQIKDFLQKKGSRKK